MVKTRIAVLVSGGGTNLQAILDAQSAGRIPDGEVVLVVANNNQHKKLVIQAAEAGKDVICEKPVAMSIEDLDEMKETLRKLKTA